MNEEFNIYDEIRAETVRDFTRFIIDESEGEEISLDDIVDLCIDYQNIIKGG